MRPLLISERKIKLGQMLGLYGRFLKFKLSTTTVGGGATLEDQYVKYFSTSDLVIAEGDDEYSMFPRLTITDDVFLLGNMFSTNYDNTKSFTKLELKVDLLEVYLEAQLRIDLFINGDVADAGGRVDYDYSNIPPIDVIPEPITFHEKFKLDIMQAYRDANGLSDTFDQDDLDGLFDLEEQIDEAITKEKNNGANDMIMHPMYKKLYGAINKDLKKMYNVYYPSNSSSVEFNFKKMFLDNVADIVYGLKTDLPKNSGSYGVSLFDSIILKINDGKQEVTVG